MTGRPARPSRDATPEELEDWFDDNGLPYFVADRSAAIEGWLSNTRIVVATCVLLVATVGAGFLVGQVLDVAGLGTLVAALVFLALLGFYAGGLLRMSTVLRWAVRRTFSSLSLLFPLVTRALPLLLLFVTFLFINTEVWQVASTMRRSAVWGTVAFFAVIAVVFLLVRLPEEVRRVEDGAGVDGALPRLARVNLVLVLLFNQAIQVLLLSVTVFASFLVFGSLAIGDDVIASWVGSAPTPITLFGHELLPRPSDQLFQVSLFLSAFSGLYFTVYAVTDQTYREQFFTAIADELETAVDVHRAYREKLS